MDVPPNMMYQLLEAPGYYQIPWTNSTYLDNTKTATIDSSSANNKSSPLIVPNTTPNLTSIGGNGEPVEVAAVYCPQPVKCEPPHPYADTGGYSITALGAPAVGSSTAEHHQLNLYGTPTGPTHPPDPQQLSNLFFAGQVPGGAGAAYPATPQALMGSIVGAGDTNATESEQLKQQKELIYAHPLFPMLTVLFQKCELATCTPREPAKEGEQSELQSVCSAASFNQDLEEFVRTVQHHKPFYVPNQELDSMMISVIQVLRYHLLELEKVHELCDNFCAKYVHKIKERTTMDSNIGEQPPIDHQQQSTTPNRNAQSSSMGAMSTPATSIDQQQQQMQQHFGTPLSQQQQYCQEQQMGGHLENMQQQSTSSGPHQQQMGFLDLNAAAASSAMANTMTMMDQHAAIQQYYAQQQQMNSTAGQHVQQHQAISPAIGLGKSAKRAKKAHNSMAIHQQQQENHPSPDTTARTDSAGGSRSSTAAATIEEQQLQTQTNPVVNGSYVHHHSQVSHQNSLDGLLDETGGDDGLSLNGDSMGEERNSSASPDSEQKSHQRGENGNAHDDYHQKRKVPKVFSKEAISKFRAWLFNNITHPYPAEEQKKQLAAETGLTILQVNNWFINARRRIVQPMIDSNNRAGNPVSVFKNRRRKSSGGNGTSTPSPQPGSQSPTDMANGTNGNGGEIKRSASPDGGSSIGVNSSSVNNSGGSSSSTGGGGSSGIATMPSADHSLLNFSNGSSAMGAVSTNSYNAAVAAVISTNPYANFAGAFPFAAGMGGMSAAAAMMPYGLNSGGWSMDLSGQTHRGGLD